MGSDRTDVHSCANCNILYNAINKYVPAPLKPPFLMPSLFQGSGSSDLFASIKTRAKLVQSPGVRGELSAPAGTRSLLADAEPSLQLDVPNGCTQAPAMLLGGWQPRPNTWIRTLPRHGPQLVAPVCAHLPWKETLLHCPLAEPLNCSDVPGHVPLFSVARKALILGKIEGN